MIAVFSTSSPRISVALFEGDNLVAADAEEAPGKASGACLAMLQALLGKEGASPRDLHGFVADVGPGGFSGTRVGVTLAKTLGFACAVRVAGVDAFDLIAIDQTVAIPVTRGLYSIREPGGEPRQAREVENAIGYGPDLAEPDYPLASRLVPSRLDWVEPETLLPAYRIEPSISTPKKPYAPRVTGA